MSYLLTYGVFEAKKKKKKRRTVTPLKWFHHILQMQLKELLRYHLSFLKVVRFDRSPATDVIRSCTLVELTPDPENWTENIHAGVL